MEAHTTMKRTRTPREERARRRNQRRLAAEWPNAERKYKLLFCDTLQKCVRAEYRALEHACAERGVLVPPRRDACPKVSDSPLRRGAERNDFFTAWAWFSASADVDILARRCAVDADWACAALRTLFACMRTVFVDENTPFFRATPGVPQRVVWLETHYTHMPSLISHPAAHFRVVMHYTGFTRAMTAADVKTSLREFDIHDDLLKHAYHRAAADQVHTHTPISDDVIDAILVKYL